MPRVCCYPHRLRCIRWRGARCASSMCSDVLYENKTFRADPSSPGITPPAGLLAELRFGVEQFAHVSAAETLTSLTHPTPSRCHATTAPCTASAAYREAARGARHRRRIPVYLVIDDSGLASLEHLVLLWYPPQRSPTSLSFRPKCGAHN